MKRSKIISTVAEEIMPILNEDLTSEIGLTISGTEQLVDIVLRSLEKEGMLPPFNHDIYSKTWRNGGSGYKWDKEGE